MFPFGPDYYGQGYDTPPRNSQSNAPSKGPRFQFSLRALLIAMLLASIGMSWVAVMTRWARKQREPVPAKALQENNAQGALAVLGQFPCRICYDDGNRVEPSPSNSDSQDDLLRVESVCLEGGWDPKKPFTDAEMAWIESLPKLKSLRLGSTRVTDEGLRYVKGLTQLERLSLASPEITDTGLEHLEGLGRLKSLHLGCPKITDAGLQHLKRLTQLEELDLDCPQITDAGLQHLKGLDQLQDLLLCDAQLTDEGVKMLQQSLPNCTISK